jgi:hypothetical protein
MSEPDVLTAPVKMIVAPDVSAVNFATVPPVALVSDVIALSGRNAGDDRDARIARAGRGRRFDAGQD